MADRRMIWKTVSQSKKLNQISIEAALLWTWCIPWFDRDGYMEADPDWIKFNVVPRRKELSEDSVSNLVMEIEKIGLWDLFTDQEGKLVAKEKNFKSHQSLQYSKESKSKWEGKQLKSCFYSKSALGVVEAHSKSTLPEESIKERAELSWGIFFKFFILLDGVGFVVVAVFDFGDL